MQFEYLIKLYQKDIYRLCLKLTKNEGEADDLFQEVWLKAFKNRESIITESHKVKSWLITICINTYRDIYSKRKRWLNIIQDFFDSEEKDFKINSATRKEEEIENIFFKKEDAYIIESLLKEIDDKYRIPIILHFYHDLKYENISQILSIPIGTVKYRVHIGKKKLREKLILKGRN
ncbi:sigma-70 family RNA polymerase sigma factor [Clostridium chauvoei]|uniref:Sigma-70 family RNA polymerase sigma factor n=2 Tax=Clostridium chauvoei TaxID=46867 RepID=A0ABD4RGQ6_9CLOT|nr:sigma-70 family RNA polymerase sigma factor [Clostridium chauvoei]ATD55722.1 hypothetical protein BTM20_10960 [Clostridium chauvoei]ATD56601.1 hypothetical protein BTM21_02060 [Clostridium chauvoei]MBX7280267.1 sigma-70 family RNA polymerase sigma factor [Clostridium chauvoei]MBX7282752.1 sigma-70 family RNA polymerase sigma factor [Clostridium chauvoei]MBX7285158.1 sigma-70 family RNA polymerase sigma factor [Clostridium chauvoei]